MSSKKTLDKAIKACDVETNTFFVFNGKGQKVGSYSDYNEAKKAATEGARKDGTRYSVYNWKYHSTNYFE